MEKKQQVCVLQRTVVEVIDVGSIYCHFDSGKKAVWYFKTYVFDHQAPRTTGGGKAHM